jgi:hypothetical protein
MEGGAVLQPHNTAEGGEPQGSRKGRPRDPLEGRREQAYESVERKHNETQNSEPYVHRHQQNAELAKDTLGRARGVTPEEPAAENLHGGIREGEFSVRYDRPNRARSWKRRTQPRKI